MGKGGDGIPGPRNDNVEMVDIMTVSMLFKNGRCKLQLT